MKHPQPWFNSIKHTRGEIVQIHGTQIVQLEPQDCNRGAQEPRVGPGEGSGVLKLSGLLQEQTLTWSTQIRDCSAGSSGL